MASGFLGRCSAVYFADYHRVVTPIHRELDITNSFESARKNAEYRSDIVLHCAAISDARTCEYSWNINVNGCVNIARAVGQAGAKCVLCRSDKVYFRSSQAEPHSEAEYLSPKKSVRTRGAGGKMRCLEADPDCVLLRLSWMYDSQTMSVHEHGDFLRTLLPQLSTSVPLSYPIYDRRCITDVNEVIGNLESAFHLPGGVYNFGAPNRLSTFHLMQQVFRRLGLDEGRLAENIHVFSDSPRNLCMDMEKLQTFSISFFSTDCLA